MIVRGPPTQRELVPVPLLMQDRRLLALWLLQGLAQVAYSALLFTLLIVVLEQTRSSTHTGLLVLSFIMPSVLLGPLVGVLLDRWPKDRILFVTSLLRAATCVLYLLFHSNVWAIYGLSLVFSGASLFFNPSVIALIPALVPQERLVSANSLYNFTVTAAQLLGMVFLAPVALKLGGDRGAEAMFIIGGAMLLGSALLALGLARRGVGAGARSTLPVFRDMPGELREVIGLLLRDRPSALALLQLTTSQTLVLLFATLIPRYMDDILGVAPDNAAFVFAPTGIGALVGLRFLPWAARRLSKSQLVAAGMLGIALSLLALALVQPLAVAMAAAPDPLHPERLLGLSLLQLLTMVFAGPLGFSYAFLNAPAQTVLHERAPPHMRGRIFTLQAILANFLALLPVLFIGGLTDILDSLAGPPGVTIVMLIIAFAVTGIAVLSLLEGETRPPRRRPASVDRAGRFG